MTTTIEYWDNTEVTHICLDGDIKPEISEFGLVTFKGTDETFSVPLGRLVSVYTFEAEEEPAQLTLVKDERVDVSVN